MVYLRYISGRSLVYLKYISSRSQAYLRRISGLSKVYIKHFSRLLGSVHILRNLMDIIIHFSASSQLYIKNINISFKYLKHFQAQINKRKISR